MFDLQNGDYLGFIAHTRALPLRRATWSGVYLKDAAGRMIFDSDPPAALGASAGAGTALERTVPGAVPPGDPWSVSNLKAYADGTYTTEIEVPVTIEGSRRYYLGARVSAAVWQRIVMDLALPPPIRTAVVDRDYRIIARSRLPERFVGTTIEKDNQAIMSSRPTGSAKFLSVEKDPSVVAWETIRSSHWLVAVGVPSKEFDDVHVETVALALFTATGCLALGFFVSFLVAGKMIRPLRRLAEHDLSGGAEAITVREIAALRDSLAAARRAERESGELVRIKGELLKKKAAEVEAILATSPVGLALAHDRECLDVTHNDEMGALIDALGVDDKLRVFQHGEPLPPERQPLLRAAAYGETTRGMELEFRKKDKEQSFIVVNAVPLFDESGVRWGGILAAMDITERKQAEQRLNLLERDLRESQRLVDLAQETGEVGFLQYGVHDRRFQWTPGMARLFGLEEKKYLRQLATWARCIDGADWRRALRTVSRCLAARQEAVTVEYCVRLSDGTSRWLSTRLRILYAGQTPDSILGVTIDMSEQKTAETERDAYVVGLQQARIEAEAANRAKDEFLAMLGHELRNPLSALACSIEVLERSDGNGDAARTARDIIARQTRHLSHMMDDLLDVSRVMARNVEMARYPLALHALVERVLATLRLAGEFRAHVLEARLEETWIEGNATRFEQIVNNLVLNAVKYTPPGSRIEVRVMQEPGDGDGANAVLEVADDGPGIADELLPHVFDLFVQGKRDLDRRAGGLGIGLTLVRRLVELHGGTITAANRRPDDAPGSDAAPSSGARMRVVVPAIAAQALRPRPAPGAAGSGRPKRVVVVDDNHDLLSSLCQMLRDEGHAVFSAEDGARGLELILGLEPDVAVVDIGLPGLDGYQIAGRCRARGFRGRLIAFSGYGHDGDREKALAAGFDTHFLKPVVSGELLRAVADD
ncbi:MAG: ATP-binding protein [Propionivibrio sp.]